MASLELRAVAHRLRDGLVGRTRLTRRLVSRAVGEIERIADELDQMEREEPADVMRLARKLKAKGVRIAGEQYREIVNAE